MFLKKVLPGVCAGPSPNISHNSFLPTLAFILGCLRSDFISDAKQNSPIV